jgi:hypothetical protein
MTLRKSIVFIGSVLILAACDRASAPTGPMSLHDGAAASFRKDSSRSITTRTTSLSGDCAWYRSGDGDSVYVCNDPQIQ